MRIALKLFASLTERLPPEARARHRVELDVEEGATVLDVIRRQGIPEAQCFLVLVDGAWVAPRGSRDARPVGRPGPRHLASRRRRLSGPSAEAWR